MNIFILYIQNALRIGNRIISPFPHPPPPPTSLISRNNTRNIKSSIEPDYSCHAHEYRCSDGLCIKMERLCDGINHCADASDELEQNCNAIDNGTDNRIIGKCLIHSIWYDIHYRLHAGFGKHYIGMHTSTDKKECRTKLFQCIVVAMHIMACKLELKRVKWEKFEPKPISFVQNSKIVGVSKSSKNSNIRQIGGIRIFRGNVRKTRNNRIIEKKKIIVLEMNFENRRSAVEIFSILEI